MWDILCISHFFYTFAKNDGTNTERIITMQIFKEERIIKLIEFIKDEIKDTAFRNHVFVVGGSIRDSLLGLKVKDIDLVVDIPNGGVLLSTFLTAKNNCYRTGKNPVIYNKYGTAKFQFLNHNEFNDIEIECVQTRKEQYHNESRNPKVVFGELEEDAKRRDFTVNSIYYNISSDRIEDPNNGLDDILNAVIKTPSNPRIIFMEDPLRILRAVRFSCKLGWGIEKDTWLGMIENAHRIDIISQERITDEITKILTSHKPSVGIRKMLGCGLLHRVLPDIYDLIGVSECGKLSLFDHTMSVLDVVNPCIEHRLAALFHDVGKVVVNGVNSKHVDVPSFSSDIASHDLFMMKYPNSVIDTVEKAIKYHMAFSNYGEYEIPRDKILRKFIHLVGDSIAPTFDLMNANNAFCGRNKKKTQVMNILNRMEELENIENMQNVKLPVSGKDIMEKFNLKQSPLIGTLLNEIREAYFERPDITKEECFELVDKILNKVI